MRDPSPTGIMLSIADQTRVLRAFEDGVQAYGSRLAGIMAAWGVLVACQQPQMPIFNAPRLITALQAALPLFNPPIDPLRDPTSRRLAVTPAQALRMKADELDRAEVITAELRSALREHLAVAQVRAAISDGAIV